MRSRWLGQLGLLLAAFVLTGCGASKVKVSGQVLFQGKPLPGGRLTFQPANPKLNSVPAEIDEQGNYEAMLPAGEVKVSVDNRELQPPPPPNTNFAELPPGVMQKMANVKKGEVSASATSPTQERMRGKYVPIPEKYYTVEDSGLEFKIESGTTKLDIELKEK